MPWYGIAVALGLGVLTVALFRVTSRAGAELKPDIDAVFPKFLVWSAFSAFVCDVIFTGAWRTWFGSSSPRFGFTFMGFLVGALIFFVWWGRCTKLGARFFMCGFLPAMVLAQSIGRIGCFLGGCCYGCPCELGVHYPPGSLPHAQLGDVTLFPIQLVESLLLFVLFLASCRIPFARRDGVCLLGMGLIRFVLEYFRADERGTLFGQSLLSPQQIISLLLILLAARLLASRSDQKAPDPS